MPAARTPEQIRDELATERTELAEAVDHLRGELDAAANITGKLKSKLPAVAGAAASVGDGGPPTAAAGDARVLWADDAPSPPGAHNPAAMAAAAGTAAAVAGPR